MIISNRMKLWTADEDQQLIELASKGTSLTRIAIRLRRTERGIMRRAASLGVKLRSVSSVRKANGLPTGRFSTYSTTSRTSSNPT